MSYGKDELLMAYANRVKIATSAIRLKHSIAADNELNRVMPVLKVRLATLIQSGQMPAMSTDDILALTDEAASVE